MPRLEWCCAHLGFSAALSSHLVGRAEIVSLAWPYTWRKVD
jgi:hypothetical protein